MFDSLEKRVLMAATTYNLVNLLGYDRAGSSYRYRTSATVGQNDLVDASSATTTSKTVTRKGVNGTDPLYLARTTTQDNEGNQSLAFTQAKSGVFLTSASVTAKGVDISFAFSNVGIAPTAAVVGKTYTDTGTVKGNIDVDTSYDLDGKFSGDVKTTFVIYGRKSVTVRGVRYNNAIEGAFVISVNGTLKVSKSILGQSISESGPITLTQQETFFAVPGIGVVTDRRSVVVSGSISNSGNYTVPISARDDLISYVLGENA